MLSMYFNLCSRHQSVLLWHTSQKNVMKMIEGTVVHICMEGVLILIIKFEKLLFQRLQKPHCCNRGEKRKTVVYNRKL